MNKQLEKEIVKHIFYNFGINSKLPSIKNDSFLLKEFHFESNNYKNKIWGIDLNVLNTEFNIFLIDISENSSEENYLINIIINNVANYYLYYSEENCSIFVKSNKWIHCSTYLQGTFLSGMEQIREIGFYPKASSIDKFSFDDLKNIISIIDSEENEE